MPNHPETETVKSLLNKTLERIRVVERLFVELQEPDIPDQLSSWTWQSTFNLTTGLGHKFVSTRDGVIKWARAERSSADGTSTAILDVLLEGVSLFPAGNLPTVPAGELLGPECAAEVDSRFFKGNSFQINVLDTGGGTGPLRASIHFVDTPT